MVTASSHEIVLPCLLIVLGPPGAPPRIAWAGLLLAAGLAVGALAGHDRTPFRCGIAIAGVNVILLVLTAA